MNTLGALLSGISQAGDKYFEGEERKKLEEEEARRRTLQYKILQDQDADRTSARALEQGDRDALPTDIDPALRAHLMADPVSRRQFYEDRRTPAKPTNLTGGEAVGEIVGGMRAQGSEDPFAVAEALAQANPTRRALYLNAANTIARQQGVDARRTTSGEGGLTATGQRSATRAGAAGLAGRRFQNAPPGFTLTREMADRVTEIVQSKYPDLTPDEVSQIVLAEMEKALDQARQRGSAANRRAGIINEVPKPRAPTTGQKKAPAALP